MTVEALKAQSLDDLLAFKRLQDLLTAIIAHLSDQDAKTAKSDARALALQSQVEQLAAAREQDGVLLQGHQTSLGQMSASLEACQAEVAKEAHAAKEVTDQQAAHELLLQGQKDQLAAHGTQLQEQQADAPEHAKALAELRQAHDASVSRLAGLEEVSSAHDGSLQDHDKRLAQLRAALAEPLPGYSEPATPVAGLDGADAASSREADAAGAAQLREIEADAASAAQLRKIEARLAALERAAAAASDMPASPASGATAGSTGGRGAGSRSVSPAGTRRSGAAATAAGAAAAAAGAGGLSDLAARVQELEDQARLAARSTSKGSQAGSDVGGARGTSGTTGGNQRGRGSGASVGGGSAGGGRAASSGAPRSGSGSGGASGGGFADAREVEKRMEGVDSRLAKLEQRVDSVAAWPPGGVSASGVGVGAGTSHTPGGGSAGGDSANAGSAQPPAQPGGGDGSGGSSMAFADIGAMTMRTRRNSFGRRGSGAAASAASAAAAAAAYQSNHSNDSAHRRAPFGDDAPDDAATQKLQLQALTEQQEKLTEQQEKEQKQLEELCEKVSQDQKHIEQLSGQLDKVEFQLRAQEKTVGDIVQAKIATLEAQLKGDLYETRLGLEKSTAQSTASSAKQLEETLRATLDSRLQALQDQSAELADGLTAVNNHCAGTANRVAQEVSELRMRIEVVANMDSCVTARCLSCYDRRSPERTTTNEVIGADGRTFKQGRPTATVEARVGQDNGSIAARLPLMGDGRVRGAHKPGTKGSLNGGAGAPLHQINKASLMRVEDPGSLRHIQRTSSSPGLQRSQAVSLAVTVPSQQGGMPDMQITAKDRPQSGGGQVTIRVTQPLAEQSLHQQQ